MYSADIWDLKAHSAIIAIAPFVEKGSYIQIVDDIIYHYWIYQFDGKAVGRKALTKLFVDFTSKDEVLTLFEKSAANLVAGGFSRQQLAKIIDETLISEIFD